ncbi:HD domain-containing protein [Aeromonas sp. QDB03]|uniref:HD domain-containing protein n=1 Tax=Aeromonas sp. QDB03 TaxID=2989839 RepID=UPI0022E45FC1|nr:ATP-binding protein [Aeromonas sp. QDB03]
MKIIIPEKFKSIMDKDDKLMGALLINNSNFSDWLSNNSLDFFPEYTDHGIAHVNCVLTTAAEIISPASYEILTPSDIYVLSTSILLHDCAMHINRDGLWSLLTDETYNKIMWGFDDDVEWHTKWDEFKQKVKRFTDSDWDGLFGEFRHVKLPELHEKSLNDNQKILIGDFVRTHHATIAQLIANSGIPTQDGPLDILSKEFSYLNQLSGFIARSHNYSLRHATDLLGDSKKREHRDTHPTYLMGVLRIADYIQFKANRTPKILFKTKNFCSPISIKEWKKHLAIISTNNSHPDDELLFVEAFPEDAITLNSIKYLLLGLQREIDDFWSVSGEVYSRYPSLKRLGIIYRRIRSNIDNADEYVRHNYKKYHHDTLKIISENQKLFPLLIKPLYGDLPQIGIRELLQNAIDACHERYSIEMGSNVSKLEIPYSISITINLDTLTLTISDQGIGMNVKIIKDYFLKIGASYRTSEAWKAHFLQGDHSFIPRTGKFGIGMLAGFLVGDEIRVITRHVAEDSRAIDFKYKLDSTDIELLFTTKTSIGTSVEIKSDRERLECIAKSFNLDFNISYYGDGGVVNESISTLSSNWFFLDTPKINIECIVDGERSSIENHKPYSKK